MTPAEALEAALSAEHAAVYVYGVLGGRLDASDNPGGAARLRAAYEAHRGRRDAFQALIADRGQPPEGPAAAYDVETGGNPADLLRVARETETRCAAVYAQLVAGSTGRVRRFAIEALTDAAVRLLDLGGRASAYPGAPELDATRHPDTIS